MEQNINTERLALPLIKNASIIYLRLTDMEVGEVLDINPQDLPKSYKSASTLVKKVSLRYSMFFEVKRLVNPAGWRVTRVQSAADLKALTVLKPKQKTSESQAPARLYNMTDSKLFVTVNNLMGFAKSDIAELEPRGITLQRIDDLLQANMQSVLIHSDMMLLGDLMQQTDLRDAARDQLLNKLGHLRTMAQNSFGSKAAAYRAYNFEGLTTLSHSELPLRAAQLLHRATAEQAQLLAEGCTPAFLANLQAALLLLSTTQNQVGQAEGNRLKATEARILANNANYTELEKICNTAKDVYRSTSAAKFNDYLIYG